MKAEFVQVNIELPEHLKDIAIALLAEQGYEAFEEVENGVDAYISRALFDEAALNNMLKVVEHNKVRTQLMPAKNWNAAWEENYPSVFVDRFCQVIPTFRGPEPGFAHCLVIDPKMAFGTGNHETTRLMIRQMQHMDFQGCHVLDMGCGTGILGILAEKLGANSVTAIDIDPWSQENALENVHLNGVEHIKVLEGDADAIPDRTYNIILANINRNVLLSDMPIYETHLKPTGKLLISGFYAADEAALLQLAQQVGLTHKASQLENNWMAMLFEKT